MQYPFYFCFKIKRMQTEKSAAFSTAKITAFSRTISFHFGEKQRSKQGPLLMGILNITADSFYAGSRFQEEKELLQQAEKMLIEGADILDLGAVSTRPGAMQISEEQEFERLIPMVRSVQKHFPTAFISVDTYRSNIAKMAVDAGASMINDISGGTFDDAMGAFAGSMNIPYILMHIHGRPETMHENPLNTQVISTLKNFFVTQVEKFEQLGVKQIILDPGLGFGKSLEANYEILASIQSFRTLGYPILIGLSRKSMINKVLETLPVEALNGTTVLHTLAIMNGADLLRVHDVKEAAQAVKLCQKYFETIQ